MSEFADFIRNATEAEKRVVYLEVLDAVHEAQQKVLLAAEHAA